MWINIFKIIKGKQNKTKNTTTQNSIPSRNTNKTMRWNVLYLKDKVKCRFFFPADVEIEIIHHQQTYYMKYYRKSFRQKGNGVRWTCKFTKKDKQQRQCS